MPDSAVPDWVADRKMLLLMPLAKFFMGCTSYLGSVILLSWRDLEDAVVYQIACLVIGVMSMSTVYITLFVLYGPKKRRPHRVKPHEA